MQEHQSPNKTSIWRSVGRFFGFTLLGASVCAFTIFVIDLFFPAASNTGLDIAGGLIRAYITIAVTVLTVLISRIYYGRRHLQETWGQSIGYSLLYMIIIWLIISVAFYVSMFMSY